MRRSPFLLLVAACTPAQLPLLEVPPATVVAAPATTIAPAVAPPPDPPPSEVLNPFAASQEWRGTYVCAQGETQLFLKIKRVDHEMVHAVFAFFHDGSGVSGAYEVSGAWSARSGQLSLVPGAWLHRPSNYVTVGLTGTVSKDVYEGRVDNATCKTFRVRLGRDDDEVDY